MDDLISRQPKRTEKRTETHACDLIYRQAAIDALSTPHGILYPIRTVEELPSAQPERLTNDDFETIRIHLNAYKEKLCNQQRWKEAEEYQRIIDRFMAFASAQPERDIPIKPVEATETIWGGCVRAAVCPKCDYHLGRVYFLSDGHDIGVRKISYCETCGQAIDWSEWKEDEE